MKYAARNSLRGKIRGSFTPDDKLKTVFGESLITRIGVRKAIKTNML